MIVTQITTHVDDALARFLSQYKAIPAQYTLTLPVSEETLKVSALFGIMAILVDQVQQLENVIVGVSEGTQLFNGTSTPAVGAQLDVIGQVVGLPRNGLDDVEYIVFLFGKIAENFSDDTITAVTTLVSLLFQVTTFIATELFPAEMAFEVPNTITMPASLFTAAAQMIQGALGGGIGLGFLATYPPVAFIYAHDEPVLVTTGNISTSSNPTHVTGLASTTGISQGMSVCGAGIPADTTVVSIAGSTAVLSNPVTQTLTAVTVVFGGQVIGGGYGDDLDLSAGGGYAADIYTNAAA